MLHNAPRLMLFAVSLSAALQTTGVTACTSFLITKGASADGSNIITYVADSHTLYGELYYTPARSHVPGEMLEIYEWDTGKHLGQIKQVPQTYAVIGNMNEHQVAVSETTWGGKEELHDPKGILDYGSLIYISLQRSKTAREVIETMANLVAEYGYHSEGESFSIADPNEIWIMDIIGKGPKNKGAVWAARRVPDGYITAHANNPRIREIPLNDPENTRYAKDVFSFARDKGYFKGKDEEFSFADAYQKMDYGAVRFCDSRVWCMFNRAAPSLKLSTDWVKGVKGAAPMPIWIKPDKKLSVHDVMELMRDHFEGTEFDMTRDIGAGPYCLPYRWRPLTWKADGVEYLNERATSTQQTGFSFVSQLRSWLPDPIGGVLWFGVDDTYSTVYVPIYCGNSSAPHCFAVGTGSFQEFNWDAAFWVFNYVSNFAYLRYADMIKDVRIVQRELEGRFIADQPQVEAAAQALYAQAPRLAVDYLTEYSARAAQDTVTRWRRLGESLLVKYLDGNVKNELGKVTHPGYPKPWYDLVSQATGEHLEMHKLEKEAAEKAEAKKKADEALKGTAEAIMTVLNARGLHADVPARLRIKLSWDIDELKTWLTRAATAKTSADLFTDDESEPRH